MKFGEKKKSSFGSYGDVGNGGFGKMDGKDQNMK